MPGLSVLHSHLSWDHRDAGLTRNGATLPTVWYQGNVSPFLPCVLIHLSLVPHLYLKPPQLSIMLGIKLFLLTSLAYSSTGYRILPYKRACLNKRAPNFWFYLAISQKLLNWSQFSALNGRVSMSSPHEFHCHQTRVRVRFLPPCPARLFGEIWY